MHTELINIAQRELEPYLAESALSFRPFINYLKERKQGSNKKSHKSGFFDYVIGEFEKHPELLQHIDIAKISNYEYLLELVYDCLSPVIEDEEKQLWALSQPLNPKIFYSTNGFYNLISSISSGALHKTISGTSPDQVRDNQLRFSYSIILEKCYGLPGYFKAETVYSLENEGSGLMHYYKMKMDTRFIDVLPKGDALPEFNIKLLQSGDTYDHNEMIPLLMEHLPLDQFKVEGVGIAIITDVTVQHVIENIRTSLLNRTTLEDDHCLFDVNHWLRTIAGSNDIEFGLMPMLHVNNKLIFDDSVCGNSILIKNSKDIEDAECTYMALAEHYLKNPKRVFWGDLTGIDESKRDYVKILRNQGVKSYALVPLVFNERLAGVLEIYSLKPGVLTEAVLSQLDPVMPLIAQALKNTITEFNDGINMVIREKFTSVQPAVQWKFNEAAWHYIRDEHIRGKVPEIEQIEFRNVFPLYGAVDIRNSTIERNAALIKDFKVQFNVLTTVLNELKQSSGFGLIDEKIFLAQSWLPILNGPSGGNQEIRLNDFFENNIHPFLKQFGQGNPQFWPAIKKYFTAIDDKTGIAFESRRQLESSMSTVISSVNNYLEDMKNEIQEAYPSYFEKFRTDGVEYDIYIGQDIAPDKPFSDIYLKNLRLLQLTSMAAIAKLSHALLNHLAKPVETTQLIFIHSHPIDIRFRNDEKRFDVEGAYNIRYHIIKKRIDKVRIKNTKERLTQPNKIAIVYFSQKEAEEQISYIRYLQEQNMLTDDLEELELEDLQGVIGLKALRVGVMLDETRGLNIEKLFSSRKMDQLRVN